MTGKFVTVRYNVATTTRSVCQGLGFSPRTLVRRCVFIADDATRWYRNRPRRQPVKATVLAGFPKPWLRRRLITAALMTARSVRSRKIDSLMKGILEDIQLLAENRALSGAIRYRIRESTGAMFDARGLAPPECAIFSCLRDDRCWFNRL